MDLIPIARIVAVFGLILLAVAGILYLVDRMNLSPGSLPGDIHIQRGNFSCVIPLVSSLILSIVITVVLNLLLAILRK